MRAVVCWVKTELDYPVLKKTGVLARTQVWGAVDAARKQEVFRFQPSKLDPLQECVTSAGGDLELHGTLSVVLHHDRSRSDLIPVTDIAHSE
jgi:hypothetical protein